MTNKAHLYDLIKESFLLLDFGDRYFFERYGLTVSRYYALYHVAIAPGLSPTQLSQCMFCDKSNITRLLQGLESDGYIERRPHVHDRRIQCLHLTAAGASLEQCVTEAHQYYIAERLTVLNDEAADHMIDLLCGLNYTLAEALQKTPSGQKMSEN
jgi:DNA-binding MarR family transcriptional regulator